MTLADEPTVLGWATGDILRDFVTLPVEWLNKLDEAEAVASASKNAIVLVVTGCGEESILEALATLRDASWCQAVMLVLEMGQGDFVVRALAAGADDYLYMEEEPTLTARLLEHKIKGLKGRYSWRRAGDSTANHWWTLFESSPIGMKLVDEQGIILRTNGAMTDFLGYEPEEFRGRTCQGFTHPEDLERCQRSFQELFEGKRDLIWMRKRFRHRDGSLRWADFFSVAIRDAQGRPREFIQMVIDVNEARQLEEHYQRLDRLAAMGRLAGHVAHDFNNLLAIIMSEAYLLSEMHDDGSAAKSMARRVMTTAERGSVLTRQLMTFGRSKVCVPRRIELESFFATLEELITSLLGKSITVELACDAPLPPIWFDLEDLKQVAINLALNARDAMPRGGRLTVTARISRPEELEGTSLQVCPVGECVVITVEDSGTGIAPEIMDRIFEPFFTTKPSETGTGLGLATAMRVVTEHGGHIAVESRPGQGATFKVFLPAARA